MTPEGNVLPLDQSFESQSQSPLTLERWRDYERFRVIDAGDGEIALYSKVHQRFLRFDPNDDSINGYGGQRDETTLPPAEEWGAERLTFLQHPTDRTKWAIHCRSRKRFMRMTHSNSVDTGGGRCNRDEIPVDWLAEWFQMINHPQSPPADLKIPVPYEFIHSISQVSDSLLISFSFLP